MSIAVKICGITSADAVDAAVAAGAVYGGLVFHEKSPRFISREAAGGLAERMRGRLRIVALIADLDDARIATIIKAVHPDFLQLHGGETPARIADIRARSGLPVIKALSVGEESDLDVVVDYEEAADMLLFDAKAPKGAMRAGGHGVAFDWKILRGRSFVKPWLLAGGLTPENVARAIDLSGARNVDVSSGVEDAPGVKSAALISNFIAATRNLVRA